MTTPIQLPRKIASQLLHYAQQAPDTEICGLVSAKNDVPQACYPISNTAQESKTHFLLDSHQHIAAMKKMRENSEELFAIYHSHPTAAACPSTLDLDMANYENTLYFIISLSTKGILELRAFKIKNKNALEIPIVLSS